LIAGVAERAGVRGKVTAHCLRYSFADFIENFCDVRTTQAVLGHASIATTETYLSAPRLDRLAEAMKGATLAAVARTNVLGAAETLVIGLKATTGLEPV